MLIIRLTRIGKKNDPKYRIIVAEKHSKRDGKYIDKLGFYDPIPQPHIFKIDEEKLKLWIERGAKMSEATYSLAKKHLKKFSLPAD